MRQNGDIRDATYVF